MRTRETTTMLTLRLNKLIGQLNGIKKMIVACRGDRKLLEDGLKEV